MPRDRLKQRRRSAGRRRAIVLAAMLAAVTTGEARSAETLQPSLTAAGAAQQAARNSVQEINFSASASGQFIIRVLLKDKPKRRPSIFASYHPAMHIVVDFVDTDSTLGRKTIAVGRYGVRSLEVVPTVNHTRLVILADPPLSYATEVTGCEVLIRLDRGQSAAPRGDRWGSSDGG